MSDKKLHKTSIGGQAVIEGVMMKGPHKTAIAVRKPDKEIVVDVKPVSSVSEKCKIVRLPIIRGCVNFFGSMVTGVRSLMFSAEFFDLEEEQSSKLDRFLERKFGDRLKNIVIYSSVVMALCFSILLFFMLPAWISGLLRHVIHHHAVLAALEGVIRISIFMIYLLSVSRMQDIQRVFMYHGAEHKSIHCYEHGEELTVENIKKHSRLHPRCGTSFLLIVMIISIFVFLFITSENVWLRLLYRLLLLPVVAGISYEIIKFTGRHDNRFTRAISKPGMLLQYMTTKEPDDSQIEVAIASLKAVIPENKEEDRW